MDLRKIIKQHSFRDLGVYSVYLLFISFMRIYSTFTFRIKCKIIGVNYGKHPNIWGKVYIHRFPGSRINIGDNVRIISSPYRYSLNIFTQSKLRTMSPTSRITIGNNVGFDSISILARSKTISIGDNTLIGGNCQIMDTDGHPTWPPESRWSYPGDEHDADVHIGRDVFIGLNVIILKGVTIGDNSVLAAGSVVNRSIPANCLAAGIPAQVVKQFIHDSSAH